jgi:hypothetical protein
MEVWVPPAHEGVRRRAVLPIEIGEVVFHTRMFAVCGSSRPMYSQMKPSAEGKRAV